MQKPTMIGETADEAAGATAPDAAAADDSAADAAVGNALAPEHAATIRPREIGGRDGPEPTRYGDWEKNGRCIDF